MRVYSPQNVYDAALDRIRAIFDEFPNIIVGFSGGKDSVVVYNLAMQVAKEKGRLPLKVMWLDQELEWQSTEDVVKKIMYNPDVDPYWLQIPFKLFNATSGEEQWLNVWGEGEKWAREKDPISKKENIYNCDRFADMFTAVVNTEFKGEKAALLGGVRCEESPSRTLGLTNAASYKWITWGKVLDKKDDHYTFYPIYDWSYMDVWKAIHNNGWEYSKLYDMMYQYGVPVPKMRVSNYHHETAVHALFFLQEFEPETYQRATERIGGIDTAGKLGKDDYFVNELPFMFDSWLEYRDYLLDNLITNPTTRKTFYDGFARYDKNFGDWLPDRDVLYKTEISTILTNDYFFTKMRNWEKTKVAIQAQKDRRGVKWGKQTTHTK